EDEHRVLRLGTPKSLHDLPGQRADVGPPMAPDLGFISHAAERDANELAAERLGDRTRQGRLADAWGANETQNRTLDFSVQLANCQILQNAILGLFKARV